MIPKRIHYVWLGNAPMPASVTDCIKSWKKHLPDYTIKCWNEKNFDLNSVPWVKEAIEKKKWSFASDYIRLYALYTEGGIYMDTDVKVFKNLDNFLQWDFFTSIEFHPDIFNQPHGGQSMIDQYGNKLSKGITDVTGMGLLAAFIASTPQNQYIKDCLDFFNTQHFIRPDNSLFTDIINPSIMAAVAIKYGFKYKDEDQLLKGNMMIYNSSIFAGDPLTRTKESYIMHYCDNSWIERSLFSKIKVQLKRLLRYKHK